MKTVEPTEKSIQEFLLNSPDGIYTVTRVSKLGEVFNLPANLERLSTIVELNSLPVDKNVAI